MLKFKHLNLIIFILLLSLYTHPAVGETESRDNVEPPEIKVALGLDLMDAKFVFSNGCKVFDNVRNKEAANYDKNIELAARFDSGGKIAISGLSDLYGDITIKPKEPGHFQFKGNKYRGYLRLIAKTSGIWIINHVDIEEYLYGVVPYEVPMSWSMEAVKAQAVAARTYAVRCLGQYPHNEFDVYNTVKDQVYGGINGEEETGVRAVEETRGVILTYQGWPIRAYYHADSGGQTEDGKFIFPGDLPYLKSVPSKDNLERHRWYFLMKKSELSSLAKKARRDVGEITGIRITDTSPTGRPRTIVITGSKGKVEFNSNDFRKMIGAGRIRSTLFTINTQSDSSASSCDSTTVRSVSPDSSLSSLTVLSSKGEENISRRGFTVIDRNGISNFSGDSVMVLTASSAGVYQPKIDVKPKEDEILFSGSGFGHGVGLSQWGAKAYADDGWDYRKILLHFYQGAELSVWY